MTMSHTSFLLDETLYQKNFDFWIERNPGLQSRLLGLTKLKGMLISPEASDDSEENGDTSDTVDILVESQQYFGEDVWQRSKKQIDNIDKSFMTAPINKMASVLSAPKQYSLQ